MDLDEVAREEVPREEQVVPLAVEAAVPLAVARQVDHPQPAPEGKLVAVAEEFVDPGWPVAEGPAARRLQPAAPAGDPLVGVEAVDVGLLGGMAVDRRARPLLERREVAGVVQMTVGEQDAPDRSGARPSRRSSPRISAGSPTKPVSISQASSPSTSRWQMLITPRMG